MAKKSKPTPAVPQTAAESEAVFAALVQEKVSAGLSRSDSEFCARQQMTHDAALAAEAGETEAAE